MIMEGDAEDRYRAHQDEQREQQQRAERDAWENEQLEQAEAALTVAVAFLGHEIVFERMIRALGPVEALRRFAGWLDLHGHTSHDEPF